MHNFLDFEKPIAELEGKIAELRHLSDDGEINIADEVEKLQGKVERLLRQTYGKLSAWQKTQVARHPDRPHFQHYIAELIEDFTPLSGDRLFAEDHAIVGGLGRFRGYTVMVIGLRGGAPAPLGPQGLGQGGRRRGPAAARHAARGEAGAGEPGERKRTRL